jgi:hypothetical protein
MAKAPEDRYGTCLDLIRDFRAEAEGMAGPPPVPLVPAAADPHPRGGDGGRRQSVPSATMSSDKLDSAVRRLRGRRPPRVLALTGVLLLVLAVAAILFVRNREEPLSNSFAGNNLVPFSFRYPGGWQQEGQEVQVVFSPRAGELLPLFSRLADGWAQAGPVVDQHPSEAVGLFTFFGATRLDGATVEEIQQQLQTLLPQEVRFSQAHDRVLVGGYLADRLEGSLRDPRNQAAALRFQCYVVHVQPPEPKSVFLVYFSSSADFDSRKALFARITGSVDFLS